MNPEDAFQGKSGAQKKDRISTWRCGFGSFLCHRFFVSLWPSHIEPNPQKCLYKFDLSQRWAPFEDLGFCFSMPEFTICNMGIWNFPNSEGSCECTIKNLRCLDTMLIEAT